MSLSMSIDSKELTDSLLKVSNTLEENITVEMNKISDVIIKEAKTSHRFKSKTGNLVEATKKELGIDRKSVQALYTIDDVKAPYGKYIHDGKKGWSADKYLENSVVRNEKNIEKAVETGIDNTIKKAGL
jgi:phosphoribosylaminoimidazole-succinocarboxamide synthase